MFVPPSEAEVALLERKKAHLSLFPHLSPSLASDITSQSRDSNTGFVAVSGLKVRVVLSLSNSAKDILGLNGYTAAVLESS